MREATAILRRFAGRTGLDGAPPPGVAAAGSFPPAGLAALPLALAFLVAGCAAGSAAKAVRLVPGDQRPLAIESTRTSADGRSLEVRLAAPRGVFALDLELAESGGGRLEQLVLVVEDERFCEGLDAEVERPGAVASTLDLRGRPDVRVSPRGMDLEVVLGAGALDAMRPRARIQFVNQWR